MSTDLAILGGPPTTSRGALRAWPDIRDEDRRAVMDVLDRGILTGSGSVAVPGLEREYAAYLGVRHCVGFNAGTAALHACAVACELKPGDEVIVPAFTYVASAMAMCHQGVHPVFVDVEDGTYDIDASLIEERLTDRTRAIVVVHLHGMPADMDAILEVARRHDLAVIEDVAQAHGATYRGRKVGSFGRCAGASLNATKNLPGGEGGLFVSDDDDCVLTARRLRYMGEDLPAIDPPMGRRYWSHGIGWNYRPHELPAAFALSQLARIDEYNAVANANARILNEGLAGIPGVVPPRVPEGRESVWYIYRARLAPAEIGYDGDLTELRDRVLAALDAEGVPVMMWQHHPLPAYTAFRREQLAPWQVDVVDDLSPWDPADYPVATAICDGSIVLGTGATPLAVQSEDTARAWVAAVAKVLASLDELLAMPFDVPQQSIDAQRLDASGGRIGTPPALPV